MQDPFLVQKWTELDHGRRFHLSKYLYPISFWHLSGELEVESPSNLLYSRLNPMAYYHACQSWSLFLIFHFHLPLLHTYRYGSSNERHHQFASSRSKEIAPFRYIQLVKRYSATEDLYYHCASVRTCTLNRLFSSKSAHTQNFRYAPLYTKISVLNALAWKLFADISFHDSDIALRSMSTNILDARINLYIIDVLTSQYLLHDDWSS